MKKREIGNLFLHLGVAGALAGLVCWNYWFVVLATFVYAWLREQAQHRWIITGPMPHLSYPAYQLENSTFFGWMTWKRMGEVFAWTGGSILGCLIFYLVRKFL